MIITPFNVFLRLTNELIINQHPSKYLPIRRKLIKSVNQSLTTCANHVVYRSSTIDVEIDTMGDSPDAVCSLNSTKYVESKSSPPVCVVGMKVLDKEKFTKKVAFQTIPVPKKNFRLVAPSLYRRTYRIYGLRDKFRDIERENNVKMLSFDPDKVTCVEDLDEDARKLLTEADADFSSWREEVIDLNYDSWSAKDILKAVVPEEVGIVSGFENVGHILHLNLKSELLEYKHVIGQVFLEKFRNIRTVVNKLNNIDNTYRNFQMEILAGEDDMVTTVKENGCTYKFDFSKVYWNSRLGTEHTRIAESLKKKDLMFDVFAGIGPFAIPAAKRGVDVLANDLNPHSYESMVENLTLNKIKTKVSCTNLDGREFIRSVMKPELLRRWKLNNEIVHKTCVVMNLPGLAVTFLDEFFGLFSEEACDEETYPDFLLPRVHCYTFGKALDTKQAAIDLVQENLGETLPSNNTVRFVRNVAPNKDMYCVSFTLPRCLLFTKTRDIAASIGAEQASDTEPPEKKQKSDDDP